ncbi:13764_t:CDS:2 [Funneliformis geosporum]|nr:13764_t:CDS:2 [Funneliformis geosporum]
MVDSAKLLYLTILLFVLIILSAPFFSPHFEEFPITKEPELHGNFLHITDLHPDPLYDFNATVKSRCHKRFQGSSKPKHMFQGEAGPWGAPTTICDSPLSLIDATFEWLENNWKDQLDFIIWTGDNSRHDNDENFPRTPLEMFQLNRMISEKFLKTFANTNKAKNKHAPHFIPIVPSIGNNDIFPHNIIEAGPNSMLAILHDIWSPFIPNGQHETFINGGYYYTEVIPGKVLVISLNTMYFFKSNSAVNGCVNPLQPGTKEMKWLNDVLKLARKRGMKVYLTGHVAPRARAYTITCYKKYGRLSLKYQDIILGHYYGHSNMDHFFFIGSKGLAEKNPKNNTNAIKAENRKTLSPESDSKIDEYVGQLFHHYRAIPSHTDDLAKDYVVVNINPSVIPTFFPALRIVKYNTTEVTREEVGTTKSHQNTFLTPLGYTQYFMNITQANLYPNVTPEYTVEYTTWDDYFMKDLTVPSWIQLARDIANNGLDGSLWEKVQEYLLVGANSLIKRKNKSFQQCRYSSCSAKGPEDYLVSELSF